jgi:hypothetical protein
MAAERASWRSCDYGLCGLPRVRSLLSAASLLVLVGEELFPVPGFGSGWAGRRG